MNQSFDKRVRLQALCRASGAPELATKRKPLSKAQAWKNYSANGGRRDEFEMEWKAHLADQRRRYKLGDERAQRAFEAGDKGVLLRIISGRFQDNIPVPQWAQEALIAAVAGHKKSWDEVFGRPLKKGKQPEAQRRRLRLLALVPERIWDRSEAGEPITKALFDSVGQELGVSGTVASDIYYYAMAAIGEKANSGKI